MKNDKAVLVIISALLAVAIVGTVVGIVTKNAIVGLGAWVPLFGFAEIAGKVRNGI